MIISKTKQLEKFQKLIEDKSLIEKCQLRMEHKAVKYYDGVRKRTDAQLAKALCLPVSAVRFFRNTDFEVWDALLDRRIYYRWVAYAFGETVEISVRNWETRENVRDREKRENLALVHNDLQG